jgi:NADH-quinone oxidoreductase subunit E
VTVSNEELRATADRIVSKYPNKRSAALPLLFLMQSIDGFVTEEGMREVGDILGLTHAEVLATASFYTMLKKHPQGDYLISVCRNITCTHVGARKIFAALEDHLGIATGETTPDGRFTLESAECLATCDGAPAMQVNYEDFLKMNAEEAIALVDRLAAGEDVRSSRGERVRTVREVSLETATAGLLAADVAQPSARTVGGESPRPDTAPGFRPPEKGSANG